MRTIETHNLLRAHTLALIATFCFAWIPAYSQTLSNTQHPVAKLVEWELTANPEIKEDALRRMAGVIVERIRAENIPSDIAHKIRDFWKSEGEAKREILALLSTEELKRLVVISAPIDYFEIRESDLSKLGRVSYHELNMDGLAEAKHLLKFKRGGESYIRWPIHPLANAEYSRIAKLLTALGHSPEVSRGFLKFNFTASRSLILFEKSYYDAVSVKVSLPKSEGPFPNKAVQMKAWNAWTQHNDWIAKTTKNVKIENLALQHEPFGLAINSPLFAEDGFLVRSLGGLAKGEYYLVPGFSVLTDVVGSTIALHNGSRDPKSFWYKHFLRPLALGMAELRAHTGAEHTSPHSQNLLVKLNLNFQPIDKVVVRDFDFYIDRAVFTKLNQWGFQQHGLVWPTSENFQTARFSLRNGLYTLPSWLTDSDCNRWMETYFSLFRQRFSTLTGIPSSVAFESTTIKRYGFATWSNVTNGEYIVGGKTNIHGIEFSKGQTFLDAYLSWNANKKQAESVPVQQPKPEEIKLIEKASPEQRIHMCKDLLAIAS